MHLYTYDGSFEGLLTVVFEAFERKAWPAGIAQEHLAQPLIFGETIAVVTDEQKAARVWRGLQKKLSVAAQQALYYTYLWEQEGVELLLFAYIRLAFEQKESIEGNYTAPCVLQVQQAARQVHREKHRMEAFVRFEQAADGLFYAVIAPDFNVLPLIMAHFEKRYADQRWAIYDTRRRYGVYYDLTTTTVVELELLPEQRRATLQGQALHAEEAKYKQLWQVYFDNVTIPERRNPKLHRRHMPKRYWKYLCEKQPH
ncbi:TIGR03915 family putative DNA repair protein [Pontibacter chitinilyticus]|uniref:TIGR03915 family putative DNA repair protein n=1 Tax=Pontibacter chitinilyticus TaxID=2674989 RepID=UPI00321AD3CF